MIKVLGNASLSRHALSQSGLVDTELTQCALWQICPRASWSVFGSFASSWKELIPPLWITVCSAGFISTKGHPGVSSPKVP